MKNWYSGTGGGSGDYSMFVDWDQEKLNKYDINPELYDHRNIKDRPSILIDDYTSRKKYLTILFLLDETKKYIIGSKYDPVQIGLGEAGMERTESEVEFGTFKVATITGSETCSQSPSAKSKKNSADENTTTMLKSFVTMIYNKEGELAEKQKSSSSENPPLSELMKLYDMYMHNLSFHKTNGTLTDDREKDIIAKVDELFKTIEDGTSGRKR